MKTSQFISMALFVFLACQFLKSQSPQKTGAEGTNSATEVIVGPSEIRIPKGAFLLIRKSKGKEIGAIRFTSIDPGETVSTGKATYESFFQSDGTESLVAANVTKLTGNVDIKSLKGVGRMSLQLGHTRLRVGKWSFGCDDPGWVNMFPAGKIDKDYGFEFAPTSARDASELDVSDKTLQWFRFDLQRRTIRLSLSDLPK